jgi:hypothetical protein
MKARLVKYDAMCQAITAAYTVDEVKDILSQQQHLALFLLLGEVAHGSRWEQEGEYVTY